MLASFVAIANTGKNSGYSKCFSVFFLPQYSEIKADFID